MDKSKEYREMCMKSPLKKSIDRMETGDCYSGDSTSGILFGMKGCKMSPKTPIWDITWHPRQDQLWGMIKPEKLSSNPTWNKIFRFYRFASQHGGEFFDSVEKLLFAFVMEETFQRRWSENGWIEK